MERMLLIGTEDVLNAGQAMRGAADQMSGVATNIGYEVDRMLRGMDDFITRFEAAVERMKESKEVQG